MSSCCNKFVYNIQWICCCDVRQWFIKTILFIGLSEVYIGPEGGACEPQHTMGSGIEAHGTPGCACQENRSFWRDARRALSTDFLRAAGRRMGSCSAAAEWPAGATEDDSTASQHFEDRFEGERILMNDWRVIQKLASVIVPQVSWTQLEHFDF